MKLVKDLYTKLEGKKTYLVAASLALYAVLGFLLGRLELDSALKDLFAAGAVFGFRSALNK